VAQDEVSELTSLSMYALNRAGTHVVIMSARPEYVRTTTEQWLDDKYVVYDELILRLQGKQCCGLEGWSITEAK